MLSFGARERKRVIVLGIGTLFAACLTGGDGDVPIQSYSEVLPALVLGDGELGAGGLYRPAAVAIDSHGRIFVLDVGHNAILLFTAAGEFLETFGQQGYGPGEMALQGSGSGARLLVDDDVLVVFSRAGRAVYVFTRSGDEVTRFVLTGTTEDATLSGGRVVVAPIRSGQGAFRAYALDGAFLQERGVSLVEEWGPGAALANRGYVASTIRGIVKTYVLWPMLDLYLDDGRERRVWLDSPQWWGEQPWSVHLRRPRELMEQVRSGELNPMDDERLRVPLFADIEPVPGRESVVILVERGPVAQFFSMDGSAEEAFRLLGPTGEMLPITKDIALGPNGSMLCAAVRGDARVYCYDIASAEEGADRRRPS